jgi:inorganic pyrophosphatase
MRGLKWSFAISALFLYSCNVKDYNKIDLYSESHRIQAVVEIPAGSSHQIEYCGMTHRFNLLTGTGNPQSARSLPFPFNVGFIPSTMIENTSISGQTIDVLVLSETLQTGNVIEILPIGLINVKKEFGIAQWIVAIPYNKDIRVVSAGNLEELESQYSGIIRIIEDWLCYSDPGQKTTISSWQDEVLAVKFIQTMALN